MTAPSDRSLGQGSYAQKQLSGRFALLAWSHRRRFETALELARGGTGPLLDYGCGDGTFLAMARHVFPVAIGVDVDPHHLRECETRFAGAAGLRFMPASNADSLPAGSFGVAVCTEVLEHCPDEAVDVILHDLHRLTRPDGRVIISVPIEIGPPLVIKQVARTVAGWRVHSDYRYRERYT